MKTLVASGTLHLELPRFDHRRRNLPYTVLYTLSMQVGRHRACNCCATMQPQACRSSYAFPRFAIHPRRSYTIELYCADLPLRM